MDNARNGRSCRAERSALSLGREDPRVCQRSGHSDRRSRGHHRRARRAFAISNRSPRWVRNHRRYRRIDRVQRIRSRRLDIEGHRRGATQPPVPDLPGKIHYRGQSRHALSKFQKCPARNRRSSRRRCRHHRIDSHGIRRTQAHGFQRSESVPSFALAISHASRISLPQAAERKTCARARMDAFSGQQRARRRRRARRRDNSRDH